MAHSVTEWLTALQQVMPRGKAWPRDNDADLNRFLMALAERLNRVEYDASRLHVEMRPEDVSRLYPAGFTIVEVDELPEGFGIEASWYYKDGEVLPVPVDYSQLAEKQRQRLLNEAKDITSDWKTELELGTISDDDKARLTKWMAYIKAVKALDLSTVTDEASFYSINWPERPDAAA
ncbi:TPA: tail fiber assembly protein [Escherichia coli]